MWNIIYVFGIIPTQMLQSLAQNLFVKILDNHWFKESFKKNGSKPKWGSLKSSPKTATRYYQFLHATLQKKAKVAYNKRAWQP